MSVSSAPLNKNPCRLRNAERQRGVQTGGTPHAVVLKRLKAHFIFRYWSRAKAASGERHIWNPRAVQRLLSQLLVDVFT
jgi:hypothetical protein